MSYKSKATERRNRAYVALSAVLVVIMGFSALAPFVRQEISNEQNQVQPTETPAPVIPTPISDLSTLKFDTQAIAKSGLFTVAMPSGWTVATNNATASESQLTQRNDAAETVIETRVVSPTTPVTDVAGVEAFFTTEWLQGSWRGYTKWETSATKTDGDHFVMDFTLKQGQKDYIARQESWTDGDWIYVVRVVTPPNAVDQLLYLLDNTKQSLKPNKQYVGAPFDWASYFDPTNKYLIRYPSNWIVTDSANGAPTSLSGDGATIRIETLSATVADEDSAKAWVETTYGATVTSAVTVDRFGTTGYGIAYQLPNLDGGNISGYALILVNDTTVSVADLRMPNGNIDLNDEASAQQYSQWKGILDSFGLFTSVNVVA